MADSTTNSSHFEKIPALDGVRGIAILLVYGVHTTPQFFPGGQIGVDLFFVLSGFLITSILLSEYKSTSHINLARFYVRRGLRLLPALCLMVSAVVLYTAYFQPAKLDMTLRDALAGLFYFFNWKLVLQWPDIALHQWMFTHIWSLSVEEQFYIVWPLFTLVILRSGVRPSVIFSVLAIGITFPALGRAYLWESGAALDLYFRTDLRFDGLMWGAMIAWLAHFGYRITNNTVAQIAGVMGFGILIWLASQAVMENGMAYQYGLSLAGLGGALLICGGIWGSNGSLLVRLLSWGPLCWVGKISYGLYLWHWPVIRFLVENYEGPKILKMVLGFVLSFAIATASFYLMERHFLRLKDFYSARRLRVPAG